MPTTAAKRAKDDPGEARFKAATEVAKANGQKSLYAYCRESRAEYQKVRRAVRDGVKDTTPHGTLKELERLGLLDIAKGVA